MTSQKELSTPKQEEFELFGIKVKSSPAVPSGEIWFIDTEKAREIILHEISKLKSITANTAC